MQFHRFLTFLSFAIVLQTIQACRVVTVNPPTLFDPIPLGFSQIRVDRLTAVAHVAGQVAINVNGTFVGETLAEQLLETERNIKLALEAVHSDFSNILRINVFILNFDPETDLSIFQETGKRLGNPAATLVSTQSLALEGLLVEIELDAAIPRYFARRLKCT